jgi:hypothetical protein
MRKIDSTPYAVALAILVVVAAMYLIFTTAGATR